jgi:hypothetical protein
MPGGCGALLLTEAADNRMIECGRVVERWDIGLGSLSLVFLV